MKPLHEMTEYDFISYIEGLNTDKRFLPYAYECDNPSNTCKRANFIFFSDSHIDLFNPAESLDNVKRTIEYANNSKIPFDALIHAGDIVTPFNKNKRSEVKERASKFFDIVKGCKYPFVFSKGNCDTNDLRNLPENVLTDSDWSELFFDYAESKYGIVRQLKASGEKSTWHYLDIEDKKIRIVSVDVFDTDKSVADEEGFVRFENEYGYISNEQMNWIVNEALDFDDKEESDWGVIFTFHMITKDTELHENACEVLHKICVAFNEQKEYVFYYKHNENSFFDLNVTADFTRYANKKKKPHMICWLIGHEHADKYRVRNGINIIWILNHSAHIESNVVRVLGTQSQNAFDVMNIDTANRKIRMIRYGAGVTCHGENGDRFIPDGLSY